MNRWCPGQPSNYGLDDSQGILEGCSEIKLADGGNYLCLNDAPCLYYQIPKYICEYGE